MITDSAVVCAIDATGSTDRYGDLCGLKPLHELIERWRCRGLLLVFGSRRCGLIVSGMVIPGSSTITTDESVSEHGMRPIAASENRAFAVLFELVNACQFFIFSPLP